MATEPFIFQFPAISGLRFGSFIVDPGIIDGFRRVVYPRPPPDGAARSSNQRYSSPRPSPKKARATVTDGVKADIGPVRAPGAARVRDCGRRGTDGSAVKDSPTPRILDATQA